MRLLYIDPHPVPDTCPEAMQILQTVDGLAQIGCEVILATPQPRSGCRAEQVLGRPAHEGIVFRHLSDLRGHRWLPLRSGRLFYRAACRLVGELDGIDGILVRNLKLAEALLGLPKRPPIVFETHEVFARTFAEDRPQPAWKDRRKLAALRRREGGVYARSDGIAALTQWLLDDLREEYGVATPGVVVPDGVDLAAARAVTAKPAWSDPPELLYLGSLHPWKGVGRLLEALPGIAGACLLVAGGPPARIAELERQAAALGVAGRVRFLGSVPPERRFQVIADADVCLLPLTDTSIGSRYTSPLKLFEYMAAGKPIVAADVPALRSVITDGVDGVLAPVDDGHGLATAINGLLANPAGAVALGVAARRRAGDFSWTARADVIQSFFARLATCSR
jgi:glycosyltransferase involved in cell wall biosynthesis